MSRSNPTTTDILALPPDRQSPMVELADKLIEMLNATEKAMADRLSDARLDQEEMLAVWSLLPSKVRSAIKRCGQ